MAKLEDAHDLRSCELWFMRVQVPLCASLEDVRDVSVDVGFRQTPKVMLHGSSSILDL